MIGVVSGKSNNSTFGSTAWLQITQLSTVKLAANVRHLSGLLDRRRVDWQTLDRRRPKVCSTLAQWALHVSCRRFRVTLTMR